MAAEKLSGTKLSKEVLESLKVEVEEVKAALGRPPVLAVILVGEDPASQVYVAAKSKKARSIGMEPIDIKLPADISNEELQSKIKEVSERDDVDGILLQLPLPNGLKEFEALCCIAPEKDADGLHPANQGLLMRSDKNVVKPCTPLGCMALIDQANKQLGKSEKLDGLHAVVIGRSILVGKPVALLLQERNCTVTMCHSRTKDLPGECKRADIVVAAVGRPNMVKSDWIKPGAIVIDVGINRLDDGSLAGDVDYNDVLDVAAAVTPVPGGVGPMTIAMLLFNTVQAAKRKVA